MVVGGGIWWLEARGRRFRVVWRKRCGLGGLSRGARGGAVAERR